MPLSISFILREYSSINSNSPNEQSPMFKICSELICGSPSSSDLRQYSINVSVRGVPSLIPNFFDKEPAK